MEVNKHVEKDGMITDTSMRLLDEGEPETPLSLDQAQNATKEIFEKATAEDTAKAVVIMIVTGNDASVRIEGQVKTAELIGSVTTLIDAVEAAFPGTWAIIAEYGISTNRI